MKAMIFAAGLGTRLKPLTDSMPKALVPLQGHPLIYYVVRKLRKAGFDELVVNVHHFAPMLVKWLEENTASDVSVSISDESDCLLDTGGGIRHARRFLEGTGAPFLVHNVDIISDIDLRHLYGSHRHGALATLSVSSRESSRYLLFDDDMRLAGWVNENTGQVRSPYPDLEPSKCRKYAFSGIHVLDPKVFEVMEEYDEKAQEKGMNGFGGKFSIIDFYLAVAADYPIYGTVAENSRIVDVGKPRTLAELEELSQLDSVYF